MLDNWSGSLGSLSHSPMEKRSKHEKLVGASAASVGVGKPSASHSKRYGLPRVRR